MNKLVDINEPASNRGCPSIPLLKKLVHACYYKGSHAGSDTESGGATDSGLEQERNSDVDESGRKICYRCRGVTITGGCCPVSWGLRMQGRILKHSMTCSHLPIELRLEAGEISAQTSVVRVTEKPETVNRPSPPKRLRLDFVQKTQQKSLDGLVVPAGNRAALQSKLDAAILILVCTAGIPPTIADSSEWKTAWLLATNNKYRPPSANTLANSLIPSEAAQVQKLMMETLHSEAVDYVTVGFDGGATVGRASFTTVHATTSNREAFFLSAKDTTGVEHTGMKYAETLEHVSIAAE